MTFNPFYYRGARLSLMLINFISFLSLTMLMTNISMAGNEKNSCEISLEKIHTEMIKDELGVVILFKKKDSEAMKILRYGILKSINDISLLNCLSKFGPYFSCKLAAQRLNLVAGMLETKITGKNENFVESMILKSTDLKEVISSYSEIIRDCEKDNGIEFSSRLLTLDSVGLN